MSKRDDDRSDYAAHVAAAMDSYDQSNDKDNATPLLSLGQGIISALLAVAAAVREGKAEEGGGS